MIKIVVIIAMIVNVLMFVVNAMQVKAVFVYLHLLLHVLDVYGRSLLTA